jgi:hypothetical protein
MLGSLLSRTVLRKGSPKEQAMSLQPFLDLVNLFWIPLEHWF